MAYSSVVVGTDGSATAERAVLAAVELAAVDGADLVVVSAHGGGEGPRPGPPGAPATTTGTPDERAPDERAQAEDAAERGRALALERGASGAVARVEEGVAADVLLGTAVAVGADLIVVGSRGMTGKERFTIGSVAGAVSHHAPCDVLIVHTSG